MKPVYSVDLFPRPNVHVEPSAVRDVKDIVMGACLGFLLIGIAVLVLAGRSFTLGVAPDVQRVRACPAVAGTVTAYGKQWACAVASVNTDTATEMSIGREVRNAVCYEVTP